MEYSKGTLTKDLAATLGHRWQEIRLSSPSRGVLLILLISVASVAGCMQGGSTSDYKATLASAKSALPVAVQIEKLFGDADHFVTHYGFDSKPKVWNTEVHFDGRYSLTMQVTVSIDYRTNTITQLGEPAFWLHEVRDIEVLPGGRHSASFNGEHEVRFSMSEWRKLYESGGDLAVLGITKNPSPVPHFDGYVAAIRRDRVPVSLLGRSTASP